MGCILYLFDMLLHTNAQTPWTGDCPEFFDMPLPCDRELWEAVSDEDWKRRWQVNVDGGKGTAQRKLTLGDLLLLKRSVGYEGMPQCGWPNSTEEIAEWCEGADDLSMLLWLALTVEGGGTGMGNVRKPALSLNGDAWAASEHLTIAD